MLSPESLRGDLSLIKKRNPVILNLANYVAMDLSANALLALGASPMMSEAREEIPELLQIADALVINLGTLDPGFCERALLAAEWAVAFRKPVVLDPVGAGASNLRTEFARQLAKMAPTVIRGNASELSALFQQTSSTHGVDASVSCESVVSSLRSFADNSQTVLALSGATDFVLDQKRTAVIRHENPAQASNGNPMMTKITAMGCTATALLAAFLAIDPCPFQSAVHAAISMEIAGENAKKTSRGPGSFRVAFIDALFTLESSLPSRLRVDL